MNRASSLFLASLLASGCIAGKHCGATSDTRPAPQIVASATLTDAPFLGGVRPQLRANGNLAVLEKNAIAAFDPTGKNLWRQPVQHQEWLLTLPDGTLLVTDTPRHELIGLDPDTGLDRFRVPVPKASDNEDDYSNRSVEGAAITPDGVLLALADARFFRMNPAACLAKAPCLTLHMHLPNETINDPSLHPLPGGDLLLGESELFRQLSPTGQARASFHVRTSSADLTPLPPGRIAASMDDDLVLFDLAKCAGDKTIELPRKAGQLYVRGEGECEDCRPAPPGCVIARPNIGDVDATAPLLLKDGTLIVGNDEGVVRLAADGNLLWKSEVGIYGKPLELEGEIIGIASRPGEELGKSQGVVVAIDVATGKERWSRELPVQAGLIISTDATVLAVAGHWLVAGYETSVSWLDLSKR
jgi:hypothetical protein